MINQTGDSAHKPDERICPMCNRAIGDQRFLAAPIIVPGYVGLLRCCEQCIPSVHHSLQPYVAKIWDAGYRVGIGR